MFTSEPKLFSIGTISLPLETLEIMVVNIVLTKKTTNSRGEPSYNLRISIENVIDKKPKVSVEDKVYPETYYHHTSGQVQVNETPTKV
jgi:hypothetical protein